MKLSWRGGRLKGKGSVLLAVAAQPTLCTIRQALTSTGTMYRSFILVGFASLMFTQISVHIQGSPAITLERTSCFGTCPAYRVQIDRAGQVTFTGLNRWAVSAGTTSVAASAVQQLLSEFEHLRFFALDTA